MTIFGASFKLFAIAIILPACCLASLSPITNTSTLDQGLTKSNVTNSTNHVQSRFVPLLIPIIVSFNRTKTNTSTTSRPLNSTVSMPKRAINSITVSNERISDINDSDLVEKPLFDGRAVKENWTVNGADGHNSTLMKNTSSTTNGSSDGGNKTNDEVKREVGQLNSSLVAENGNATLNVSYGGKVERDATSSNDTTSSQSVSSLIHSIPSLVSNVTSNATHWFQNATSDAAHWIQNMIPGRHNNSDTSRPSGQRFVRDVNSTKLNVTLEKSNSTVNVSSGKVERDAAPLNDTTSGRSVSSVIHPITSFVSNVTSNATHWIRNATSDATHWIQKMISGRQHSSSTTISPSSQRFVRDVSANNDTTTTLEKLVSSSLSDDNSTDAQNRSRRNAQQWAPLPMGPYAAGQYQQAYGPAYTTTSTYAPPVYPASSYDAQPYVSSEYNAAPAPYPAPAYNAAPYPAPTYNAAPAPYPAPAYNAAPAVSESYYTAPPSYATSSPYSYVVQQQQLPQSPAPAYYTAQPYNAAPAGNAPSSYVQSNVRPGSTFRPAVATESPWF